MLLVRAAYENHSELDDADHLLHVLRDDDIARTDKPVQHPGCNYADHVGGMEFDNETRILNLLSDVEAVMQIRQIGS